MIPQATRPELFNWSKYLREGTPAELAEQTVIDRYINMDHRFDLSPTRWHAFILMELLGHPVIPHTQCGMAPDDWERVVVYLTERGGHAGRDKALLPVAAARQMYPDALCSRYFETYGESVRILRVGPQGWSMRMRSDDRWRSNVGRVEVSGVTPDFSCPQAKPLPGPVYAIDFVNGYAIDFNSSPGLEGVHLGGRTAPELIEEWYRSYP